MWMADCSIEASLAAIALEVIGTSFVCAVLQEGMFTLMSAISNCNEVQDMRPEVKRISVDEHRRRYEVIPARELCGGR